MGVREGLLALLSRGPRHGYQLKLEFETATSNVWPLNIGQVYTTLQRLERDGLVTGGDPDEDGRVVYELTLRGRDEVTAWFTTGLDRKVPSRDEVTIKLLLAIEAGLVPPAEVAEAQRVATLTALQDYVHLRSTTDDGDSAWRLQLDRLILLAEAELRWLDRVDSNIERGAFAARIPAAATPVRADEPVVTANGADGQPAATAGNRQQSTDGTEPGSVDTTKDAR